MSNLIGSSKIVDNPTMRARTAAGIRQTATQRKAEAGSSGALARAALLNPEFVVSAFLVRVSVNPAAAGAACTDCGYSDVQDGDILYVINESWAEVAAGEYPNLDTEIEETV